MNKKLLAAAVGATLVMAPVLSAQAAKVKVYGKALVEIVSVDGDTVDQVDQGDRNGRSRWGIKASENLGNGMKAFAKFEFNLSKNIGGDGSQADRVLKVGLKGGFGSIAFGRDHGAYKTAGGVKWDPYAATFMQARRAGGMSGGSFGHNSFKNDLIIYHTPKMGGFSVNAQMVVADAGGTDGEYHLAAKWKSGPLEIIGAINHDEAKDRDNAKIGARYKSGGLTAAFQYESVENGGGIRVNGHKIGGGKTTVDGSFIWANVGYKFGSNLVSGSIGGFDADSSSYTDVDYLAIGLTHFFSKKTRVYAGYTNVDVSGVADTDMIGAGIRFDF